MSHHDPFAPHPGRSQPPEPPKRPEPPQGRVAPEPVAPREQHHEHSDDLAEMRLPALRLLAESLGLDPTGRRGEVIERVQRHQSSAPPDA